MISRGSKAGFGFFTIVFLMSAACGDEDDPSAKACVPGESRACTAPGGCQGGQVCNAEGNGFESCVCGTGGTGGTGGNTGGLGGTSGATGGNSGASGSPSVCPTGLPGPALVEISAPNGTKYCIDSTEVTFGQYDEFLAAGVPIAGQPEYCVNNPYEYENGAPPPYKCTDHSPNLPVGCVDRCDGVAYCKWAGKRLCGRIGGGQAAIADATNPDVSQWFNACSGGGTRTYAYGDVEIAECNVTDVPVPVGSLTQCQGSVPGVFDLSSNAVEWEDACDKGICLLRTYPNGGVHSSCAYITQLGGSSGHAPALGFRCCHDGTENAQ